jgi:acetylornithine deacetylase/succinyl-diaminopimelate desuccinylase-like protein
MPAGKLTSARPARRGSADTKGSAMTRFDDAVTYAREHHQDTLAQLKDLIRIPSVSTLPECKDDVRRAAEWLAEKLRGLGFTRVQVLPTPGHPVVVGEWTGAGAGAPTVLTYGHYDVQPTDPIDLWTTDPFEPTLRGEYLFARGASDMKAQMIAHLAALEALMHAGTLPANVRVLFEGEEEVGSPNLKPFLSAHADLLAADFCLNADSGILSADMPAITYALRGLAYFEIRVKGPGHDLHSGQFGGAVDNPALVLCQAIAGMRDPAGRILLPRFYDKVRLLSPDERADLARLPQGEDWWLGQVEAPALNGEEGYTSTERASARPTLDVNGFLSGFIGVGSKTVLPARAMAKISMRLVADQTPEDVQASLIEYLNRVMPRTVTWEVEELSSCRPSLLERDSRPAQAAARALKRVWGVTPIFTRQGGSVPIVGEIQSLLGIDSLLLGFGLPDDNLHAPNERQHLPTFYRGIETYIRFYEELAR